MQPRLYAFLLVLLCLVARPQMLQATDLAVSKEASATTVMKGDMLTFTITVDNTSTTGGGPLDSPNTMVHDTVPDGFVVLSATASQGACTVDGRQVDCNLGTLPRDSTATVTITVEAVEVGIYTNEASVEGDLSDPDEGNNTAAAEPVTIQGEAAVSLSKRVDPTEAEVGDEVDFFITLKNDGPDAAVFSLRDLIPAGLVFVDITDNHLSTFCLFLEFVNLASHVGCSGLIGPGEEIEVVVNTVAQEAGIFTNNADIEIDAADADLSNNADSATVTVPASGTDWRVIIAAPLGAVAGIATTIALGVENRGPGSLTGVSFEATLPPSLIPQGYRVQNGECALDEAEPDGVKLTCVSDERISASEDFLASLEVLLDPFLDSEATISTHGFADQPIADPLEQTKSHTMIAGSGSARIFGTTWGDYNRNGQKDPGEFGISDVRMYLDLNNDDVWDEGEPSVSTDPNGHYEFTGLEAGMYTVREIKPVEWIPTYPQGGEHVVALGIVGEAEANFGNVYNPLRPFLTVNKTTSDREPLLGDEITFTIKVRNVGQSAADSLIITDDWRGADAREGERLRYLSHTEPNTGTCDTHGEISKLTCNVGSLAPGDSVLFTATFLVTRSYPNTSVNLLTPNNLNVSYLSGTERLCIDATIFIEPLPLKILGEVINELPPQDGGKRATAVDLYLNGTRVADDLAPGTAALFSTITLDSTTIVLDVVPGDAPDNTQPMLSQTVDLAEGAMGGPPETPLFVLAGSESQPRLIVRSDARREAADGQVDVLLVHAAPDADSVDANLLDQSAAHTLLQTLADDLAFGGTAGYHTLAPGGYNVALTSADNTTAYDVFRLDLDAAQGQVFTLVLAPDASASGGLTVHLYDTEGGTLNIPIVTTVASATLPKTFALQQNYPNPFNPITTIRYDLAEASRVRLVVYDLLGRVIRTLVDTEQTAGSYRAVWDGRNDAGEAVASGIYLYRLEAGDMVRSKTMLLVK